VAYKEGVNVMEILLIIGFGFLIHLVFRAIIGSIMWVCEPMVQYVEGKDARELKFMEKMEGVADELKKKDAGGVPAAAHNGEDSPGNCGETPERWPHRLTDGEMN